MKKVNLKIVLRNLIGLFFVLLSTISCNNNLKKDRVYLILKNSNNPFFVEIEKGVRENLDGKTEIIVKSGKDESDIASQIQYLNYLVDDSKVNNKNENIKGIIITPSSSKNELIPYIKKLNDRNIPIILVDTKIDKKLLKDINGENIPYVGSSNIIGGEQAGRILKEKLSKKSRVLLLNGVSGQETAFERKKGFHNVCDSLSFDITERIANWSFDEAYSIVSSILSNGENFDGIFAANDMMALGAIRAYLNQKKKLPIIVGFDAIPEAIKSIEKSEMYATIAQNPNNMGRTAIYLIDSIYNRKTINSNNYLIKTKIIKRDNNE